MLRTAIQCQRSSPQADWRKTYLSIRFSLFSLSRFPQIACRTANARAYRLQLIFPEFVLCICACVDWGFSYRCPQMSKNLRKHNNLVRASCNLFDDIFLFLYNVLYGGHSKWMGLGAYSDRGHNKTSRTIDTTHIQHSVRTVTKRIAFVSVQISIAQ